MTMAPPSVPGWLPLRALVVLAAVAASVGVLFATAVDRRSVARRLRARLLFGVPLGTLLTVAFVIAAYLFLQGGLAHPRDPLVLPFRAWSYRYPLGIATAAFSHGSLPHLVGNVASTLVFGSLAEYAWGHYPRERGSATFDSSRAAPYAPASLRTNPYARAAVVPATALVVGLFTALFSLGPIVGFSGVVFAFAGFALVQRPLAAAFGLLAFDVLRLVIDGLLNPQLVSSLRPRVITPWWAEIAIQGHAIGLLIGLFAGVWLASAREDRPSTGRFWAALLVFGVAEGLWAIYLPVDGGRYLLLRWVGVATVFVLATLLAVAFSRSVTPSRVLSFADGRAIAAALAVTLLLALSVAGAVYNVPAFGQEPPPGETIEVRGYHVGYAENVENGYVGGVSLPLVDDPTAVRTGGVIVTSASRHVWRPAIHRSTLANGGSGRVLLGGVGWRRAVHVDRPGWRVSGNDTVYAVHLRPEGRNATVVYRSNASTADLRVADRRIALRPAESGFALDVSHEGERLGSASVPGRNETATAGGLTFERTDRRLYVVRNGTRVPLAARAG